MEFIHPTLPNQHPRMRFTFSTGWRQDFLVTSDCHVDSSECAIDLLMEHLEEAKQRNALVIDLGDWFDVINSREDHRRSMASMRGENKVDAYVDSVLNSAVKRFGPYADLFCYMGTGNHESKLVKLCGSDITARFVDEMNRLRSPGLPPIYRAQYGGWLRLLFERKSATATGDRQSCNLKLFHGAGGGAEITKGIMEVQRMAAAIDAADIVCTGHTHDGWQVPHIRESLNDMGVAILKPIRHIKVAGYKRDYRLDGAGTWGMQRGFKPKPIGGAWITFESTSRRVSWTTAETKVDYSRVA